MMARSLRDQITQTRGGARVERCHGIPHVRSYTNAAHQWGVAHLCYVFWPERASVLVPAALFHDTPEAWVGDIPSPVLRYVPGVRDRIAVFENAIFDELKLPSEHRLSPEDHAKLKAADRLEFLLWCMDELRMGNKEVEEALCEVVGYLNTNPLPAPAEEFYQSLRFRPVESHTAAGVIKGIAEKL